MVTKSEASEGVGHSVPTQGSVSFRRFLHIGQLWLSAFLCLPYRLSIGSPDISLLLDVVVARALLFAFWALPCILARKRRQPRFERMKEHAINMRDYKDRKFKPRRMRISR